MLAKNIYRQKNFSQIFLTEKYFSLVFVVFGVGFIAKHWIVWLSVSGLTSGGVSRTVICVQLMTGFQSH